MTMSTPNAPPPRDHPELGPNPIAVQLGETFGSSRLAYRGIEQNDADADLMYRIRLDPEASLSSDPGWPRPYTRSASKEFIKHLQKNLLSVIIELDPTKDQPGLAEELKTPLHNVTSIDFNTIAQVQREPKRTPIGTVSLRDCFGEGPTPNRVAELAVHILAPYQGRGYGAEAMRWILDWAFEMGALHRVRLGCFSWNTRAINAYEAVGFERAGTEKESLWRAGRWWDFITYGILDRDWRRIKEDRRAKGLPL